MGAKLSPQIEVVTQPAQSPDLNICDLAFFRALGAAVRKLRRGRRSFDLDQLVQDVFEAFHAYDPKHLEKMWQTKTSVMKKVIAAKGGNMYPLHRTKEERRAAEKEAAAAAKVLKASA